MQPSILQASDINPASRSYYAPFITYAAARVDYYERCRRSFVPVAIGMMAASIALMGVAPKVAESVEGAKGFVAVCMFGLGLALFSCGTTLVYLYTRTTSPVHPSRNSSIISEWYYEPEKHPLHVRIMAGVLVATCVVCSVVVLIGTTYFVLVG